MRVAKDWKNDQISTPGEITIFILSTSSRQFLAPKQPSIQWRIEDFSPGVKRPGRLADSLTSI
jgi:hypothetical protein